MTAESRVVFVLVDGARPDVLQHLLDRGELPHLARWVVEPGGLTVGTTVFPSTTGVAYIPFLFGCYPGTADVPGIRWLDRAEAAGDVRAQWRAARSYCGVQAAWINRDVCARPSIFELVPESIAICTPLTRGLAPGAHRIPVKRALLGIAAHYAATYAALDRAVAAAWLESAAEPWRFLFVVFPGPDGLTHFTDPFHPAVLASYRAADRALGAFVERVRRVGRGAFPVFFFAADHGAGVMREHCDVALALEAWGVPTLRHPWHVWRRSARAAVMVSGNASAQVYFEPRSRRVEPRVLADMPEDLLARLVQLPAVGLAACRDGRGGVMVFGGGHRARLAEDGVAIRYEPLVGDPLGLGPTPASFADRELLRCTHATPFPDSARQLLQLFGSKRAGDLALSARPGSDFRGPWEVPEHKSGHGSLVAAHMQVPIAASIPLPNVPLRTVDLMPAVLECLGVPIPPGIDGVPFSQLARSPRAVASCAG